MDALDKIYPSQIEKAIKIVKQYYFDGLYPFSKDLVIKRLKPIIDDIEGFEPHYYNLCDVEQHYQNDGSTAYRGILEVTYLSTERELYILRY